MRQLIITTSHSPDSRSLVLAEYLERALVLRKEDVRVIHLRDLELPFCDASSCYGHPQVQSLSASIAEAAAITVATPIYNFEVGGATRNLVALTGPSWREKVVGFACAAGGGFSYMSVMSLANSLMLDFRCVIVPRFVFSTDESFTDGALIDEDVVRRVEDLADDLVKFGRGLGA